MKINKYYAIVYLSLVSLMITKEVNCNKQSFHSIMELEENFETKKMNEFSLLEFSMKNSTGSKVSNITSVISKAPYKATKCDQILMFAGKRIFPENDYSKKPEAFFTISAFMLNTFEKKDSSKLVKSVKLKNIKTAPFILKGSKNCLLFSDSVAKNSATVCIEDNKQREDIINSYNFLKDCTKHAAKPKIPMMGSKKKINKITDKGIKKQIKAFFKVIENPNQKVIDVPKVRQELIKELKKKGVIN